MVCQQLPTSVVFAVENGEANELTSSSVHCLSFFVVEDSMASGVFGNYHLWLCRFLHRISLTRLSTSPRSFRPTIRDSNSGEDLLLRWGKKSEPNRNHRIRMVSKVACGHFATSTTTDAK
ncbi:hypothetical protein ZHAS_00006922 [Anopheles sinensis]|uniref:Uncharacterized protein n=1 Tax=Anopheles sinensis TaxID=74873 RepID=A0A084VN89_ANOSI|nr:hypothetical protein ZHAS_00006922 [Anopheles sinensis]